MAAPTGKNRWLEWRGPRGDDYDRRFEALAASGADVHGEASLVASYGPASVLDAGCGTGRVAIELARRGVDVVGVDADPSMLDVARRKAPRLDWVEADLEALDLGRTFDVALMAGNVLLFVREGAEGPVVAQVARHLAPGGRLVSGFALEPGRLTLARYDALAGAAGLVLEERWATWERAPLPPAPTYAVSVHRRQPISTRT